MVNIVDFRRLIQQARCDRSTCQKGESHEQNNRTAAGTDPGPMAELAKIRSGDTVGMSFLGESQLAMSESSMSAVFCTQLWSVLS